MENKYIKQKTKVVKKLLIFTIWIILLFIAFLFFNQTLFQQNNMYLTIIPIFYVIFLPAYLRQFQYCLIINDKKLQVSNDLFTHSQTIYWEDVKTITYSRTNGVKIKSLTDQKIFIAKDVTNYKQAWKDIIEQTQKTKIK